MTEPSSMGQPINSREVDLKQIEIEILEYLPMSSK
jgi:hypothetical protein